jgi:hypothetical protein
MLDPKKLEPVRRGILGPERIAESFARDLRAVEGCFV